MIDWLVTKSNSLSRTSLRLHRIEFLLLSIVLRLLATEITTKDAELEI